MISVHRPSTKNLGLGAIVGGLYVSIILLLWPWATFLTIDPLDASGFGLAAVSWMTYVSIGLFLLGAIPTIALLETRLVTPALVVGGLFAWAVYESWPFIQSVEFGIPSLFEFYLLWWFAVLGIALAAGGVEYGVRRVTGHRYEPAEG